MRVDGNLRVILIMISTLLEKHALPIVVSLQLGNIKAEIVSQPLLSQVMFCSS